MIIAECAQNYSSIAEAKLLIRKAKDCGADLAKFQLFDAMKLYGHLSPFELSRQEAETLFLYGQEIGIEVFFSVFDTERVRWCEEMGVKRYKIAYRSRNDAELLDVIQKTGKPFVVSSDKMTVFSTLYFMRWKVANISDVNFERFEGISDHTVGLSIVKQAISNGARIIEKHFALSHEYGADAEWSMTPRELVELRQYESLVCV